MDQPDEQEQAKFLVLKFQRRGFEGLGLEDVANALVLPDFSKTFANMTGQDWNHKYEVKALERLNHAKFDIQWMTRKNLSQDHQALFASCAKGDLNRVRDYLKECKDPNVKLAVDQQKRSALHICAMEGKAAIVELLILNSFNPNARDKMLRTPLHYAALYGWDSVADTLLRAGADILAKDSLGRSSMHFAACGPSSIIMQLFVATRPELVNDLDHRKRSPLHYCVQNSSANQVDLLRTLLDFNADPNSPDEDLRTPLHDAAEGGKTRAIPILLQRGALKSMATRDRKGRLPLELSLNDRTREILIVYSASPLNHKKEDIEWMNNAVAGVGKQVKKVEQLQPDINQSKSPQTIPKRSKTIKEAPKKLQQSQNNFANMNEYNDLSQVNDANTGDNALPQVQFQKSQVQLQQSQVQSQSQFGWNQTTIQSWIREKFFVIMKEIQEAGIKANHHLKKPYIYTGSWMEGINTMEELQDALKDAPPCEVAIRVFNVLCPFDRPLPKRQGTEEIVDGFYGEQWFDTSSFTNKQRTEEAERVKQSLQKQYVDRIAELEAAIQFREKAQFDSDQELAKSKAQIEIHKKNFADLENKSKKQMNDLTNSISTKDTQLQQAKNELSKHQKIASDLQMELETWKNTPQGPSEDDILQYQEEILSLKNQLQVEREKEKQLRYKSGQLFIKAIKDAKESATAEAMQKVKQIELIADQKFKDQVKAEVLPQSAVGGLENMQDDESMINLLKALKGNPPPMRARMNLVDSDADGKLTQQEFSQFIKNLKLSDQDVISLCRIAGFLNGRKLLGIDEWIQILQDRPKQREMWEQKLFDKLLDAIKSRNLTLERMFELLDTDNSGTVNPAELKIGLKQLKIVLNQKDLNNLFCIFDSDKSGQISLVEMKDTLDRYQQMRDQGAQEGDADWTEEVKDGYEDIELNDNPFKDQVGKDWIINEKDFKVLNGRLKVQVPFGSDLLNMEKIKAINLRVTLKGAEQEVVQEFILFNLAQEWRQQLILPIQNTLRENLCEYLTVQLYSESLDEEHFLGDVHTSWKMCLDKPGEWVVNNKFQLTNQTYIKEAKKMKQVSGDINLQLKYEPLEDGELKDLKFESQPSFIGTIVDEGVLEITVVQLILSEDNKNVKDAKYYFDLKLMDQDKSEVQGKLSANNDVYWEKKYLQNLKLFTNESIASLFVKCYMKWPKNLIQSNTKVFGEVNINWSECILHPGQYLSRKAFLLTNDPQNPQKLYLKVRYVPKYMFQSVVGFKPDVSDEEKRKQLTEEDIQDGTLKILIVRAKNLRADDGDTSDPYVLVRLDSWKKEIKIQSKTIKKSLNPEFRDLQVMQCRIPKEAPYPPLDIEIFDEDTLGDDSLGTCKVDIAPCIENPCTWGVNDIINIKDPKQKPDIQPTLYIQAYWVPKGMKDPNLKAKDKEDQAGGNPNPNLIDGQLLIKLVHGRELNAGKGVTPDPYCTVTFPGGTELKTEPVSSTISPLWNQCLTQSIKVDRQSGGSIPLKVFVKDHNILTDAVIGYVDVNWIECVSHPGDWAVNQVFKLSGTQESKGQLGALGFVYLQVKFIERGMIDDGAEAPLVENLLDMIASKQGIWQGILKVFLVHCRDIVKSDNDELSDPYVVFKVPGGKKLETKAKKQTINPCWKSIYSLSVAMPKDTVQPLKLEVYDEDLVGDELIGYTTVDLSVCFQNPQKWAFNEILQLSGDLNMQQKYKTQDFGKVYIQMMFCLQGVDCQVLPLPLTEDIDEILREKAEEGKKPMKGQLLINVPLALGVKIADSSTSTSDPYCKITLPDGHSIETKQVDKTLDPIWNFSYKWNCNILKEQYKKIVLTVHDSDALAKDDKLGACEVDWMDCFTNPTSWEVNKLVKLEGENDMGVDLGRIYVQMNFLLDGQEKSPEGQRAPDTIPELKSEFGRVLGTVQLKILSAAQLFNGDLMGKSDPFVEAYLSSDPSKKMKTPVINDNLNPQWNFDGTLSIQLLRSQVKQCYVVFEVKDDDEVGSDFLGKVELELIDILELNPQSQMTGDYPLRDPSKKGTPNLGTLKVTMIWIPDPYNEGVVGLRQPLPMYTGDFVVNFPNARQLPDGDPYVKFFLTHEPEKMIDYGKRYVKSNRNPDFGYKEIIPLKDVPESSIRTLRVTSIVRNYNLLKDTTFGGISVPVTDCFHKPGTWVNDYQQIYDDDGKKLDSYLYVQCQYRPKDNPVDPTDPPLIAFNEFINRGKPPTFGGSLILNYVGLKNIDSKDIMGLSDPFVEFKVNKGTKNILKTKVQDDKTECFWSKPGQIDLVDLVDQELLKLFIEVYDYDYDSNDLIGKTEFDLSTLKSGDWINQRIGLIDEKGFPEKAEIYIQAQWVRTDQPVKSSVTPNNLYDDIKQKADEENAQKLKEEAEKKAIPMNPGKVRVLIEGARNLLKTDTFGQSDPFAEIKISKGDKNTLTTKTIDDNSNPNWKFSGEFSLNLQNQEYVDMELMITVNDYDTMVTHDFLGFVDIKLDDLFKNPGTWINDIFLLKDEHGSEGKNGDIYVQVQWVPDSIKDKVSMTAPALKPYGPVDPQVHAEKAEQKQTNKAPQVSQGQLLLNLIEITNLPEGKKASAKLKIQDQEIKTNLVQNGVKWNSKQNVSLKYTDNTPISADITIYDETNSSMATVALDLISLFTTPGQWLNKYVTFTVSNYKPNNQKLYIQAQWRPAGINFDTKDPPFIEDTSPIPAPGTAPIQTPQIVPQGTIKVAVVQADKILLLDGGKTSNTKVTVQVAGNDQSTPKIKGANPIWKLILKPFTIKYKSVSEVQPVYVRLDHDPGTFSVSKFIGDVNIGELNALFARPNEWVIKQDFLLGDSKSQSKTPVTGFVTIWIGFVPEKVKDNLLTI